jgi:multiple sugar transport system permease protein
MLVHIQGVKLAVQGKSAGRRERLWRIIDDHAPLLMTLPAIIILVGLVLYPFYFNLNVALHQVTLLNIRAPQWIFTGAENFWRVLSDPFSRDALIRTAVFAGSTVALQLVLGLAGAMAFNVDFKGKSALMVFALVPMMITPVVVGIAWRILLNYDWGVVNYLLSLINVGPLNWLSDPTLAMVSIITVQVWWGVSFVMLIMLGGLTSLPKDPFEAAVIDGASRWQILWYITLPMLRPVILVLAMIRLIDAFREFDVIYALTGGGPGGATRVFALELYFVAYERGDFGMAAAQALLLLGLIVGLSIPLVRRLVHSRTSGES